VDDGLLANAIFSGIEQEFSKEKATEVEIGEGSEECVVCGKESEERCVKLCCEGWYHPTCLSSLFASQKVLAKSLDHLKSYSWTPLACKKCGTDLPHTIKTNQEYKTFL